MRTSQKNTDLFGLRKASLFVRTVFAILTVITSSLSMGASGCSSALDFSKDFRGVVESGILASPPSLEILYQDLPSVIPEAQMAGFRLTGTCSEPGLPVFVISPVPAETLCSDLGQWSFDLNLQPLPDGVVVFFVQHRSQGGLVIEQITKDFFKLTQDPPAPPSIQVPGGYNGALNGGTISLDFGLSGEFVLFYQYAIGTQPNTQDLLPWTDLAGTPPHTISLPTLNESQTAFVMVRAVDLAGHIGDPVVSDPIISDSTPPVLGALTAIANQTSSTSTGPAVTWSPATDGGSGVERYEYSVGVAAADFSIKGWTTNSTLTAVAPSGLSLISGTTYFTNVRAVDAAGNISQVQSVSFTVNAPVTPPPASAPTLTSITPTQGARSSTRQVVLAGTNLTGTQSVTVGGQSCGSLSVTNSTQVLCTVPVSSTAAVGTVILTRSDGQSVALPNAYTFLSAPVLTSVTPATDVLAGGAQVTLSGSDFLTGATVTIGGSTCSSPAVNSFGTSITCTAPAKTQTGLYDVVVQNASDLQSATLQLYFSYTDPNASSGSTGGSTGGTSGGSSSGSSGSTAPGLLSVSPSSGTKAGGQVIALNGSQFVSGAIAKVGAQDCTNTQFLSASQLLCTTPSSSSAGSESVFVINPDQQAVALPSGFTYLSAPFVSTISPTSDVLAGGSILMVNGGDFMEGATVSIGGTSCPVSTVSETQILCTVPPKTSTGTYDVLVTNTDARAASLQGSFSYVSASGGGGGGASSGVTLSSVSPSSGARLSTTSLVILGTGFQAGASVSLGGTSCATVSVQSSTEIRCVAPTSLVSGIRNVIVTNPDATAATRVGGFTYTSSPGIQSVSPNHGPLAGGFEVEISGSDLLVTPLEGSVTIGGAPCAVLSSSSTSVICRAPARIQGAYDLVLSNPDAQTRTVSGGVRYDAPPTLTSVSPSSGYDVGGTTLTLTGTGILPGASVTLGGRPCTNVIVNLGVGATSASSATCQSPASTSLGTASITLMNDDLQSAQLSSAYSYTATPASSTHSTLKVSSLIAPVATDDASAAALSVALVAQPKNSSGAFLGAGKTVEVTASLNSGTGVIVWTGGSSCTVPNSLCRRFSDNGNGNYSVRAGVKTAAANISFSAKVILSGQETLFDVAQTHTVDFNSSHFTSPNGRTITTGAVTLSAADQNLNLLITGGTVTFDIAGQSFGQIFASGGVLTHLAQTSGVTKRIEIAPAGLHLGGTAIVGVKALGYPAQNGPNLASGNGYLTATGPTYTNPNYCGGSHGGLGAGLGLSCSVPTVYDSIQDPNLPGTGGAYYSTAVNQYFGGGVFKVNTAGFCSITGTGAGIINANGGNSTASLDYSGAGGSINLKCAAIDTTAFTGTLTASGANGTGASFAGGGGRISIQTVSDAENAWSGELVFPTGSTQVAKWEAQVLARGGAAVTTVAGVATTSAGGAGTVFVKHSGISNGALLISNGSNSSVTGYPGRTLIPGFSGTIPSGITAGASSFGMTLGSVPSVSASMYQIYKGMSLRPATQLTIGSAEDWSDDQIRTITNHTDNSVTVDNPLAAAPSGSVFRTLILLDYLEVSPEVRLVTNSDVQVRATLSQPDESVGDALILEVAPTRYAASSGGVIFPTGGRALDILLSGASAVTIDQPVSARHLTVNAMSGVTFTSEINLASSGDFTVSTGSGLVKTTSVSARKALLSSGTWIARDINAVELEITGGTLKHEIQATSAQTTTPVSRLTVNLSGNLSISGSGSIDVKGLGFGSGLGPIPETPDLGATLITGSTRPSGSYCGGSHGGLGADEATCAVGPAFGDFRAPTFVGAGGNYVDFVGGGAIRVNAPFGNCSLSDQAKIRADGGSSTNSVYDATGAGGSIWMTCRGFVGVGTGWKVSANGGAGNGSTYLPGGGGRISLVSTGDQNAWAGTWSYPSSESTLSDFLGRVQAQGGSHPVGTTGKSNAGAGTIYLQSSVYPNGSLIVSNGSVNTSVVGSGYTHILGLSGLVASGVQADGRSFLVTPNTPGDYATVISGIHKNQGIHFYSDGTPASWSDDLAFEIDTHTAQASAGSNITLASKTAAVGVTQGMPFRTWYKVDTFNATSGSTVVLSSDLFAQSGMIGQSAGASAIVLYAPIVSSTVANGSGIRFLGKAIDYVFSGSDSFSLAGALTARNVTVTTSGSIAGTTLTLTDGGNLSIQSGTVTFPQISAQDVLISGGTVTSEQVTARHFEISGGVIKHPAQSTTAQTTDTVRKLNFTLSGNFKVSGTGSVDVKGLGFVSGLMPILDTPSQGAEIAGGASSAGSSPVQYCGGSHGGTGARVGGATCRPGMAYGDFRDPVFPGGGGNHASFPGGGVVRVSAPTGSCTFQDTGKIRADGGLSAAGFNDAVGAGGSVYLKCNSFVGAGSTWSISANGGGNAGYSSYHPGGGGRIALITTGDNSAWSGTLSYPSSESTVTDFFGRVKALGGANTVGSAVGGAGTIYLQSGTHPNGSLLVSNGSNAGGVSGSGATHLVGMSGTVTSAVQADGKTFSVTLNEPTVANGTENLAMKAGLHRNRAIHLYSDATPLDWNDDVGAVVGTHTSTLITAKASVSGIGNTAPFRTLEKIDTFNVSDSTTVVLGSDVQVVKGVIGQSFATTAVSIPTLLGPYSDINASALRFTGKALDYVLSGSTSYSFKGSVLGRNLTINTTGTVSGPKLDLGSTGNLTIQNGTLTVPLIVAQDVLMSGGQLTTSRIDARDFSLSAGTVKHEPQVTSATTFTTQRLKLNLSRNFTLSGTGSINVKGLGWNNGYGPNLATLDGSVLTNASNVVSSKYCGGSHGGQGAQSGTCAIGPIYDDMVDPNQPGTGGAHATLFYGGGVVQVFAPTGSCSFGGTSSVIADGGRVDSDYTGAGGAVSFLCGGYSGDGSSWAIRARGGPGNGAGYMPGGGGRISLRSTGGSSSWVGTLAYPAGSVSVDSFLQKISAAGGGNSVGTATGGAGTIFIQHSVSTTSTPSSTYGALLVANDSNLSGVAGSGLTVIPGFFGTLSSGLIGAGRTVNFGIPGTTVAPLQNTLKGLRVRLNLAVDPQADGNWSNDHWGVIESNTAASLTTVAAPAGSVSAGQNARSFLLLDQLEVHSPIRTYSDVSVLNGSLSGAGLADSLTLHAPLVAGDAGVGAALQAIGKSVDFRFLDPDSFTVDQPLVGRHVSIQTSGTLQFGEVTLNQADGVFTLSQGTVSASKIRAKDLTLTGGVLKHSAQTVSAPAMTAGLDIGLTGEFNLSGGSSEGIRLDALGYPAGYAPDFSAGVGATSVAGVAANFHNTSYACGGSHGGQGGNRTSGANVCNPGVVYDQFRSPAFSGGGAGAGPGIGGGNLRLSVGGACRFSGSAKISADGTMGSAGGGVFIKCGSFVSQVGATPYAGAITAHGGSGDTYRVGGGGGRIALVNEGTTWTGPIRYPNSEVELLSLLDRVGATGGTSPSAIPASGGAGTIYLKNNGEALSDSLGYGALIVNNGSVPSVATYDGTAAIPGLFGTVVSGASGSNTVSLSLNPALGSGFNQAFKDFQIRLDATQENSVLTDPIYTIAGNLFTANPGTLTLASALSSSVSNKPARTREIIDHIYLHHTKLSTDSDLHIRLGDLVDPADSAITIRGLLFSSSGARITGGSTPGAKPFDYELVDSLSLTFAGDLRARNVSINTSGSINGPRMVLSGDLTLNSGSLVLSDSLVTTGDVFFGGGSFTTSQITARNYAQTAGVLKHAPQPAAPASTTSRLQMNLSGNFALSGSSTDGIWVDGLGYTGSYGPDLSDGEGSVIDGTTPITSSNFTSAAGTSTNQTNYSSGGSHGGLGGHRALTGATRGTTYGDLRKPQLPGMGGGYASASLTGGGAVSIQAAGSCTFAGSPKISANGGAVATPVGGAGGSIYLKCGSFLSSGFSGEIRADGGSSSTGATYYHSAGGGGRIALVNEGSTWTGPIRYPANSTEVGTFVSYVHARGGLMSTAGHAEFGNRQGGAGTLYLKNNGETLGGSSGYGALLLENGPEQASATHLAYTLIPGLSGTVAMTPAASDTSVKVNVSSIPGMTSYYAGAYKGYEVRLNVSPSTTPSSVMDYDFYRITGNTTGAPGNYLNLNRTTTGAGLGDTYRTALRLDHLEVRPGVTAATNSDVFVLGTLSNPNHLSSVPLEGFVVSHENSGASLFSNGKAFDVHLSGGHSVPSLSTSSFLGRNLVIDLSPSTTPLSFGSLNLGTTGTLDLRGGALTVASGIIAQSVLVKGSSSLSLGTSGIQLASDGDYIQTSTGTVTLGSISGGRDFKISAGKILHPSQPSVGSNGINRLLINVSRDVELSGTALMDLSGLGFPSSSTYRYNFAATPASVAEGSQSAAVSTAGGSHGGRGGGTAQFASVALETYDHPSDPDLPGAASDYGTGGGVAKIYAGGSCVMDGAARILANATGQASAGGSIKLDCGSVVFPASWNPGTSGGIVANGTVGVTNGSVAGGSGARGGGGGGRIAILSRSPAGSFGAGLPYPQNSATLADVVDHVRAWGGAQSAATYSYYGHAGGAGTIYFKNSSSTYGDLIVHNGDQTMSANAGVTDFVGLSTAGMTLHSVGSSSQAQILSSGTAFTSRDHFYRGYSLDFFTLSSSTFNPLDGGRTTVALAGNDDNVFAAAAGSSFIGAGGKNYRITHRYDSLEVAGKAVVDFKDQDLVLTDCDIKSGDFSTLSVVAPSQVKGINAMASATCSVPSAEREVTVKTSSAALPSGVTSRYYFQP